MAFRISLLSPAGMCRGPDSVLLARRTCPAHRNSPGRSRSLRDWNFADVLRYLIALLSRGLVGDRQVPAQHVRVLLQIDGLPLVARHPGPRRDVGDRVG